MVAHINPKKRGSYELNGEVGWYISPSLHHHRCVKCYFTRTKRERDCDTVEFFPTSLPFPSVTLTDHLKQAASDIVTILTQPPSTTAPSLAAGDPVRNALLTLATQLKQVQPIPEPVKPPRVSSPAPVTSPPRVQAPPSTSKLLIL